MPCSFRHNPEASRAFFDQSGSYPHELIVIGRNGVGKSRCFDLLARAFLGLTAPRGGSPGELSPLTISPFSDGKSHGFAGLVTVAFIPFDKYGPLVTNSAALEVRYAYVGLIRESAEARESSEEPNAVAAPLTSKVLISAEN